MIHMLFTAFSLDVRKDAMAGFLPLRQEIIHHCLPESHGPQNTVKLELFFSFTINSVVLNTNTVDRVILLKNSTFMSENIKQIMLLKLLCMLKIFILKPFK